MKENQEVVQIALEKQTPNKRAVPVKIAVRIKSEKQDIFVYNGRVNILYKPS